MKLQLRITTTTVLSVGPIQRVIDCMRNERTNESIFYVMAAGRIRERNGLRE